MATGSRIVKTWAGGCYGNIFISIWGCWWPGGKSNDYKAIAMGWQGLTSREGSEEKESDTPLPSTNCPD